MKIKALLQTFTVLVAFLLAVPGRAAAAGRTGAPRSINDLSFEELVRLCLPGYQLQTDDAGKPKALMPAGGEALDLIAAAKEYDVPGLWSHDRAYLWSPTMDWFGRQKSQAATPDQAVTLAHLFARIYRGPDNAKQWVYHARPFDGGWVVEVEYNFTPFAGTVDLDALCQDWVHSREEEQPADKEQIYRPANFKHNGRLAGSEGVTTFLETGIVNGSIWPRTTLITSKPGRGCLIRRTNHPSNNHGLENGVVQNNLTIQGASAPGPTAAELHTL